MYDMSPQHIRDVWMSVMDTRPALRMREIRFMYENMWFKQAYFQKDLVISDGYCVVPKDDLIMMCFYSRLFGIDDSFDHDRCGWAIQFGDVTYSVGSGATAIEWLMKYTYISDNYEINQSNGSSSYRENQGQGFRQELKKLKNLRLVLHESAVFFIAMIFRYNGKSLNLRLTGGECSG